MPQQQYLSHVTAGPQFEMKIARLVRSHNFITWTFAIMFPNCYYNKKSELHRVRPEHNDAPYVSPNFLTFLHPAMAIPGYDPETWTLLHFISENCR